MVVSHERAGELSHRLCDCNCFSQIYDENEAPSANFWLQVRIYGYFSSEIFLFYLNGVKITTDEIGPGSSAEPVLANDGWAC